MSGGFWWIAETEGKYGDFGWSYDSVALQRATETLNLLHHALEVNSELPWRFSGTSSFLVLALCPVFLAFLGSTGLVFPRHGLPFFDLDFCCEEGAIKLG